MDCIEPLLVTEDKIQLRKKSFECQLGKATMQKSGPAQCDEQKDAVNDQEAAAGPAGPSNPGVLASESSSVSVPQAVLSVNPLDPLRNNVRRKMYEIVFNIINTGTAPEPICLSSLGLGIYYLGKLKPGELLESFPLREEINDGTDAGQNFTKIWSCPSNLRRWWWAHHVSVVQIQERKGFAS